MCEGKINTTMRRRTEAIILLAAVLLAAAPAGILQPAAANTDGDGGASGARVVSPAQANAQVSAPVFTQSWTQQIPNRAVSTSSPVLVENGGQPFVAIADNAGDIRGYDLTTGNPIPGWASTNVGFGVRAPLSSDGQNVYVPVAQDGIDRYPQYKKFAANGSLIWNSNPGTVLPSNWTYGFLLSGLALSQVRGQWLGFAGSSGQWVYGANATDGAQLWGFRNADSTMATPAIADLFGAGTPQVIMSNDTSAEFPNDRNGGILRIFTHEGQQICSASQFVDGDTFAVGGYNNSSPTIAEVDGRPLIVFGSTGQVQYGPGGNQVVAYDADCRLQWSSVPLGGQAEPSPTFADVRGRGAPDVVQMVAQSDGNNRYPRVYVLDASTGIVVSDTLDRLRPYGAPLAYPSTMGLATADVNDDGAQDLFVPAREGSFLVLDGRSLNVLTTIQTNMAIQNTPIVTSTGSGIRVTMAGYNGQNNRSNAQVTSYTTVGGRLGSLGWRSFGGNPQLTGLQGSLNGPYDQLLQNQSLAAGQALRRAGFTAVMQPDGNFVIYGPDTRPRWWTGTSVPGSRLHVDDDGTLSVHSPSDAVLWSAPSGAGDFERLSLGGDGVLRVTSEETLWETPRRLTVRRFTWSSAEGVPMRDRLERGQSLSAGQYLRSTDGNSTMSMEIHGNLTVYRGSSFLWQAGTSDMTARAVVALQSDGNLVVYDNRGRPIFNANIAGGGGEQLVIGNDGILRVVAWNGVTVWSTATQPGARRVK